MNLSTLIKTRLAAMGWSMSEVARRGEMPIQTVHALIRDERLKQTPRPETMEKLARGLDIDLPFIKLAAAVSADLIHPDSDRRFLLELAAKTPSDELDVVLIGFLAKIDAALEEVGRLNRDDKIRD